DRPDRRHRDAHPSLLASCAERYRLPHGPQGRDERLESVRRGSRTRRAREREPLDYRLRVREIERDGHLCLRGDLMTTTESGYIQKPLTSVSGQGANASASSGAQTWPQRYPDTWRTLFEQLQRGTGADNLYTNLIGNFRGGQDMTDFLNWAAPF